MLDTLLRHLPMVRLSVGALAVMALVGCTGLVDDGGNSENLTPEQQTARLKWEQKAYPVLSVNCQGCHAGSTAGVAFLAGADTLSVRTTLIGWDPQVVNLDAPASSRILTKGPHAGPALTAQQTSDVLEWVQSERDAAGGTGGTTATLETAAFTPLLCTMGNPGDPGCPVNTVDVSSLVQGWGGAHIDFVAQPLSQDLYVTDLKLVGGPDGVYLEHPLFVSWPQTGDPVPDTLDRFFNVKMNLMAAGSGQIGGGTAAFVGFTPTNQITISFKVLDKYHADTGTGGTTTTGGCKQLASFKTNAMGPLKTNCSSCHAGTSNANAKSAMNLDGLNATDDATIQLGCNEVRTRINFQDTTQSGFYIAPNPAQTTNHPFKFGGVQATFNSFMSAVDPWVQAEKTSQ